MVPCWAPMAAEKTTLFKMISAPAAAKRGRVRLGDEDITGWNEQRFGRSFGYVPQVHTPPFAFLGATSCSWRVTAHLRPFASPGRSDERIADIEALDSLGILRLGVAALHGDQRRRASIGF